MHINVVLFQPEIPQNTGNISRTCSVTGSTLHLVGPLGFSLDERHLRRAGLDYWDGLDIRRYPDTDAFFAQHASRRIWYFSQKGLLSLWDDDALAPDFSDSDSSSVIEPINQNSQHFKPTDSCAPDAGEPETQNFQTPGPSDSSSVPQFVAVRETRETRVTREPGETRVTREPQVWLAFGCESQGLDEKILLAHPDTVVRIPMLEGMRSLNLSNAVAIAVYEVLRRTGGEGLLKAGRFPGRDNA